MSSYNALRIRKRDILDFIEKLEEEEKRLEKMLAETQAIDHRVALEYELGRLRGRINIAKRELEEVEGELRRIRGEVEARKTEILKAAEEGATLLTKLGNQVVKKLAELAEAVGNLEQIFPSAWSSVQNSWQAGLILKENFRVNTWVTESTYYIIRELGKTIESFRKELEGRKT